MVEDREVTWFPSYGAEVRGGTAKCTVVISDILIGSPVVTRADILVVMNEASLQRYLPHLKEKGALFFDMSLIAASIPRSDITVVGIPATEIASRLGDTKSANMVMLGALIAQTGILRQASVLQAIENLMEGKRRDLIELNRKALMEGIRYLENTKSQDIRSQAGA